MAPILVKSWRDNVFGRAHLIMRDAHIRALTGARRMRPTSIRRPWRWRHEFSAAAHLLQLRPGYALPASHSTPSDPQQTKPGGTPLNHSRGIVQTTRASAVGGVITSGRATLMGPAVGRHWRPRKFLSYP